MPDADQTRDPFDISSVEKDIGELVRGTREDTGPRAYAPAGQRLPAPGYLDPAAVGELRLTAEMVKAEHDRTAAAIEAMAQEALVQATEYEKALFDLKQFAVETLETARLYRERGQQTYDRLQQKSVKMANVRKVCEDIRANLDAPDA